MPARLVDNAIDSTPPPHPPFALTTHKPEYSPPLLTPHTNIPSPCLLFLTHDSFFIHGLGLLPHKSNNKLQQQKEREEEVEAPWLHLAFSLPAPDHPHSLITKSWSAGPHLLILLATSLRPFHPGHLSLWNPLSNSLSKLPPFTSIWHLITLGFGDNMVVAAGFDRNIQCVIEIYHVNNNSSSWRTIGHLPFSLNVQEHDEILYCGGSFYVLCMESSMLVIDPRKEKFALHDIPCPSNPKLIATCDGIFMVGEQHLLNSFALWNFDEKDGHWHASPTDFPYLDGSPSKIIYIKGIGMSICFVLEDLLVLVYDVLNHVWSFIDDCPIVPSSRPLVWEPSIG